MAISTDYATPVIVNGFSCRNCTDVDNAKKHIDPQHPKSGPYGINAKNDPTLQQNACVIFGGSLSGLNDVAGTAKNVPKVDLALSANGQTLDLLS